MSSFALEAAYNVVKLHVVGMLFDGNCVTEYESCHEKACLCVL